MITEHNSSIGIYFNTYKTHNCHGRNNENFGYFLPPFGKNALLLRTETIEHHHHREVAPTHRKCTLRALSSLRGLRGAPEVPPLCRETSVSRTANVGTVG